jgi:ABC-type phosphate/phosphonate transport system substrate-binding protein
LVLLLAVAAYFSFELIQERDPLARFAGLLKTDTTSPVPKPVPVTPIVTPPTEEALVLAAPPRDNAEEGVKRFGPFADYLSKVLGRKVVYSNPSTWGGYQSDMQRGVYDLVFDGPHFVSWRIAKTRHNVLVKLPGEPLLVVAFVRQKNSRTRELKQLAGQTVCAHAPPNLGTLMLLSLFDNPSRQPSIVVKEGFGNIYQGVIDGKCVAGIVPKKNLLKKDKDSSQTRVIYEHAPFPEQALTAGPRLSAAEQVKVAEALITPEATSALASFREAYGYSGSLVRTGNAEYAGYDAYLKSVPGFFR